MALECSRTLAPEMGHAIALSFAVTLRKVTVFTFWLSSSHWPLSMMGVPQSDPTYWRPHSVMTPHDSLEVEAPKALAWSDESLCDYVQALAMHSKGDPGERNLFMLAVVALQRAAALARTEPDVASAVVIQLLAPLAR